MWSADVHHGNTHKRYAGGAAFGMDSTSDVARIGNLSPGICDGKILGVVIAKEESRHFPGKKDPTIERHLVNFTVRDSPVDFINVTCWGNRAFISELTSQFSIGDVVELNKACVQSKPMDGSDEKFRPWTPSMNLIHMSETRSSMRLYNGWDAEQYRTLAQIPVKANNDYYTIADVVANGNNIGGQYISMLCAVRKVGPVKEITGKGERKLKRCEIKFFDETATSFSLTLWDAEQIFLAQSWIPKDTVIFAADLRVKFDDYRKSMVATATSKTIFTVNPDTREAQRLHEYAQVAQIPVEDTSFEFKGNTDVDLASINTICTVEEILDKLSSPGEGVVQHCIVFAHITTFDVDGSMSILAVRCAKCKHKLDHVTNTCINTDCPQGSRFDLDEESTERELRLEARLELSDHTGTLTGCLIEGQALQNFIQYSAEEIVSLTEEQRTDIKWKFLFEQCKIYLKISLPSIDFGKTYIRILSCQLADTHEVTQFFIQK